MTKTIVRVLNIYASPTLAIFITLSDSLWWLRVKLYKQMNTPNSKTDYKNKQN